MDRVLTLSRASDSGDLPKLTQRVGNVLTGLVSKLWKGAHARKHNTSLLHVGATFYVHTHADCAWLGYTSRGFAAFQPRLGALWSLSEFL